MSSILGRLAMRFRGTRAVAERESIARDYQRIVNQLIETGQWDEIPELPDDWMPPEFFDYWKHK